MTGRLIGAGGLRTYRVVYALLAAAVLAVPLVAMQFTAEVNWTPGDFLVFAGMLVVLGVVIDLILRGTRSHLLRAGGVAIALMMFLFVWAMLATG